MEAVLVAILDSIRMQRANNLRAFRSLQQTQVLRYRRFFADHYRRGENRRQRHLLEVQRINLRRRQPKRPKYALPENRARRIDPTQMDSRNMLIWTRCHKMQFDFLVDAIGPVVAELLGNRKRYRISITIPQAIYMFLLKTSHRLPYRLIASWMGCGLGLAYNAVKAVVFAIQATLTPLLIRAQSRANLELTCRCIFRQHGLPGVGYLVDGSLSGRYSVAGPHKREYYDRKGGHSTKLQIAAGSNHLITHLNSGFPGSVHDALVYGESDFGIENESGRLTRAVRVQVGNLELNPINAADMGYAETARTLRSRRGPNLPAHEISLRTRIARARGPCMEGVFGVTKGRFQWLAGRVIEDLPMQAAMTEAVCTFNNVLTLTSTKESLAAFLKSANSTSVHDRDMPLYQTGNGVHTAYLRHFNLV